jgi:hypothetical protein
MGTVSIRLSPRPEPERAWCLRTGFSVVSFKHFEGSAADATEAAKKLLKPNGIEPDARNILWAADIVAVRKRFTSKESRERTALAVKKLAVDEELCRAFQSVCALAGSLEGARWIGNLGFELIPPEEKERRRLEGIKQAVAFRAMQSLQALKRHERELIALERKAERKRLVVARHKRRVEDYRARGILPEEPES